MRIKILAAAVAATFGVAAPAHAQVEIQWWHAMLATLHAVEGQPRASSAGISTTATKSSSIPPNAFGWWKRKSPVSCKSCSFSGVSWRASSVAWARSRNVGTSSLARRIASS